MGRFDVAVVGAGASGLMAALTAAQAGARVALLEAGEKPGRKLLATGNGRCNLTNTQITPEKYHGDAALAAPLLSQWPASRVMELFSGIGLYTRVESEGRVYPYSLQAAAVVKALCTACDEAGVQSMMGFPVGEIKPEGGGFLLRGADGGTVQARRCILACGGAASPRLSGGGGYELARALGHTVTKLSPSLVGLAVPARPTRGLKGMRCKARAALCRGRQEIYAESGEVIFGEGSVSGICVMNLSARLRGLPAGRLSLCLDLAETIPQDELAAELEKLCSRSPERPAWELLAGLLNLRVGQELVRSLGWEQSRRLGGLTRDELSRAAKAVKRFSLLVEGPLGWENAQCTAGGVPLREVDLETLCSLKQPGLYLTGELLDLDGDCGGYNLHWAWATGATAGAAAAR